MHLIRAAKATALFEFARSLTPGRISASVVLALFPPAMMLLIQYASGSFKEGGSSFLEIEIVIAVSLFMVVILSMLLWASPVIYAELEGKTWIYLASRPGGAVSTTLGKYFIAVLWSFAVAWVSMTVSFGINQLMTGDPVRTFQYWKVFTLLIALGCIAYGAVFVLIGAIFHRRAMVIGAGYALLSEVVIANLPAVISKFTVRYHLLSLGVDLLDPKWAKSAEFQAIFTPQPVWMNLLMLTLITVSALAATWLALRMREYLTADEA